MGRAQAMADRGWSTYLPTRFAPGTSMETGGPTWCCSGKTNCICSPRKRMATLWASPEKIPFSGNIRSVQVVDADGDGRKDLLLVNWEDRNPFRFRLQKPDGQLGPEIYFPLPPIRSYWADSLEQNKRTQMVTIALNSGRRRYRVHPKTCRAHCPAVFRRASFPVLPLNRTEKARRGLAVGGCEWRRITGFAGGGARERTDWLSIFSRRTDRLPLRKLSHRSPELATLPLRIGMPTASRRYSCSVRTKSRWA